MEARTLLLRTGVAVLTACGSAVCAAAPLGADDALAVREGVVVNRAGRRVGLWGVNLFQSHMYWSRRQEPEAYRPELAKIAAAGFNAVRMPLHMAYFVPAPGVYPDDPRYAEILAAHGLPTGAMAFFDELVAEAGRHGLYVIPEFHELPSDPYRWFVGGVEADRGTGRPGRAIAWMAQADEKGRYRPDPALAAAEVPKALGWLARHWRGVPNIAGIEVPWNEPLGPLTEPEPFFALVSACADAVKAADPDRLVFMDTVDWGAMVNHMPDESVWKIPANVDVLFPHFYPGMHSNSSGADGTWSTTMASWVSWLAGAGKPVMVGEYGVVEMHRAGYWPKDAITDMQKATTYAASAAQWHAQGVQGLFAWAWQGGLQDDAAAPDRLTAGADVLRRWAAPFREGDRTPLARARFAVICTKANRAQYGARENLWRVSDALLDAHLTPFATLFDTQVAADPGVLDRFEGLLVLVDGLPDSVLAAVRASGKPVHELDKRLTGLTGAVARLRGLVGAAPRPAPPNALVARSLRQITLFERRGAGGPVRVVAAPLAAQGSGRLVRDNGALVFDGDAERLRTDGFEVSLEPWQTLVVTWQPEEQR